MRRRRVLKWVGLVACVTLGVMWIVSLYYLYGYGHGTAVCCGVGSVCVQVMASGDYGDAHLQLGAIREGNLIERLRFSFGWPSHRLVYTSAGSPCGHQWILPLWLPFLLLAIPTTIAWYRDRRVPPGHCQKCRYDLTGNESGTCPECGTAVAEGRVA